MSKDEEGLSAKAIALGAVTDIGATLAAGFVMGMAMAAPLAARGKGPEEIQHMLETSPNMLVGSLVIGLLCTMLGGWVAGKVAGHSEVKHGLVLGVIQEGLGVLMVLAQPAQPLWYNAASFVLVIPAACFGGWIRAQQRAG